MYFNAGECSPNKECLPLNTQTGYSMMNQAHPKLLSSPIILFVVIVMTYGLLIPQLGFYGDDWSYIYYHQLMGINGPGQFASYDRPFSAPFYNIVIAILGVSPLPYHVLLLILRWLSAALLYWILMRLWSGNERPVFWITLFFALYPGFSQQPISVEYILHFTGLNLFLLSVWLMLKSLHAGKNAWWLTVMGMLCAANLFAIEYFVGLELLRPVILWLGLANTETPPGKKIRKVLMGWAPYLAVLVGFLIWRVFFFQFPTYTPGLLDEFTQKPVSALLGLAKRIFSDFRVVMYEAWRQTLRLPSRSENIIRYIIALIVSIASLVGYQLSHKEKGKQQNSTSTPQKEWALQPFLLGVYGLLIAGIPFWITGIPLEMGFPWDRPTLPFMLGAGLLLVGFVELVIRKVFRNGLYLFLAVACIGFHIANAEVYQREWENIKDFYWQMTWRIPGLEEGAVLASDEIPLYREADSALAAIVNWTYAPDLHSSRLLYKLFDLDVRMGTEYTGIPGVEEGLPLSHPYRGTQFESTTSSLLVFQYRENGCFRILSTEEALLPGVPEKNLALLPLSHLSVIDTEADGAQPPFFFGPEPDHNWCYFFQKAELAWQSGDWQKVIVLAEDAAAFGVEPQDASEWGVFVEAYGQRGDLDQAWSLSEKMVQDTRFIPYLCSLWETLLLEADFEDNQIEYIENKLTSSGCKLEK